MADLEWGAQGQEASGDDSDQIDDSTGDEARPIDAVERSLASQEATAVGGSRGRHDVVAPPETAAERVSLFWIGVGALTMAAVAAVVFGVIALSGAGDEPEAVLATSNETVPAETMTQLRAVVAALGYEQVVVSDIDGIVVLSGAVPSEGDRSTVVAAMEALVGDSPIDASSLVVGGGVPPAGPGAADPDAQETMSLRTELGRITATNPLIFDTNSTELTEDHARTISLVAEAILENPGPPIRVVGFADARGDSSLNDALSWARATSVKDALVALGVPSDRLILVGDGSQSSSGSTDFANLERRVEFVVEGDDAGQSIAPTDPNKFRIALVAPSGRDDRAFTQSMVDAINVLVAEDSENFEFIIEDGIFVPEEAAAAVRGFADEGYDLIIAHGVEYVGPLQEIVAEHPDVTFAWGTATETFGLPNLYAYDAAAEEGGYVMGAMAGLLTGSNVIGVVGPIEIGDAKRYINGFKAGAQQNNASVDVRVDYINSFGDVGRASESANEHVDAGADIMTGSSEMVVGAIDVAQQNDVLWFGTQASQAPLAPNNVVASQIFHWEVILRPIFVDVKAGTPSGRALVATLANGGLTIEYNDNVPLPPEIRAVGDQLIESISSGAIQIPG